MKNFNISYTELQKLTSNTIATNHISTYSLSMWLKIVTDNQFIVIERAFVVDAIQYIELNKYTDEFLSRDLKDRWNLETIKSYI
jgi:hypothetical protein